MQLCIPQQSLSRGLPLKVVIISIVNYFQINITKGFGTSHGPESGKILYISMPKKTSLPLRIISTYCMINASFNKGKDRKMLAGLLSKSDVLRDYGTAASDQYTRYIVDPMNTQNNTERNLRKRYSELLHSMLLIFLYTYLL